MWGSERWSAGRSPAHRYSPGSGLPIRGVWTPLYHESAPPTRLSGVLLRADDLRVLSPPPSCFAFLTDFLFGCVGSWLQHAGFWRHLASFIAAHGLTSCGAWALELVDSVAVAGELGCPVACGILVPGPGVKPVTPALQGGFLTTGLPGKYLEVVSLMEQINTTMGMWHLITDSSNVFSYSSGRIIRSSSHV